MSGISNGSLAAAHCWNHYERSKPAYDLAFYVECISYINITKWRY